MSWSYSMLDASFRGVIFDVVNTRDSANRDVALFEYPYMQGADIDDLGRKARNLRISALFWGDDYERRLQTFITALDTTGSGELIHPVFGSMPHMQPIEYAVSHDADNVDYCTVEVVFLESKVEVPFFDREYPLSKADLIFNQVQSALDAAQALIDSALTPLRDAKKMMARSKALASTALNMVTIFRSEITGFVSTTTDFIQYPQAFINDLSHALSLTSQGAMSGTQAASTAGYPLTRTVIMADWKESRKQITAIAALPVALVSEQKDAPLPMPSGATSADIVELTTLVSLSTATQLALNVAEILGDDVLRIVLSPDDIELMANDVRTALQTSIDQHREVYAPDTSAATTGAGMYWRPVVDTLKATALSVQQLAAVVITLRPPLVKRTINAACNVRLLAHYWYHDHTRATEILRLNPQLRDPNDLRSGDIIYAYAK